MSAVRAFSLLGVEVDLDTKCGADGQVINGSVDVFVGRHTAMAMGAVHSSPPIPMNVDLDNFG